jgi:ferrous iron transport protein A
MNLDLLKIGQKAIVTTVKWDDLSPDEALRLRGLGIDTGVEVEPLHRGMLLFRDPIAVKIGRMTVALRRVHARAISVLTAD